MLTLDHVVVTTRDLAGACAAWERLGFAPTERGFHPFGTVNNLFIFGRTYIELFAFHDRAAFDAAVADGSMPPDLGELTRIALETRDGPSLLAVTAPDVEEALRRVAERGLAVRKPLNFLRPVVLPDGTETAADVTVNFLAGGNGNGNGSGGALPMFAVFHRNPEALWVKEWQRHPNGAVDVREATFTAARPLDVAPYLRAVAGEPTSVDGDEELCFDGGRSRITIATPERCARRFAAVLDGNDFDDAPSLDALTIAVRDVDAVARLLEDAGVPHARTAAGTVQIGRAAAVGTLFEFVLADA
jgi:hypothetical protein